MRVHSRSQAVAPAPLRRWGQIVAPDHARVPFGCHVNEDAILGDRYPRPVIIGAVRHLALDELKGPLEPAVVIHGTVRTRLQERGVTFVAATEGDWPGPMELAAVELNDASQYLLAHPSTRPEDEYLYVHAQVRDRPPQEAVQPFLRWLDLSSTDIVGFHEA